MQLEGYKLLEIRELLGLSQEDLARRIGYSREVVNKVEKGKMKASRWFGEAVQNLLASWEKPAFSPDVNILGKVVKKSPAPPDGNYLEGRRERKFEQAPLQVPLVGIKAVAGYVKGYEQVDYLDTLEKYTLPPGVNGAGAIWRYFEIDGDSMEPTLSTGDVVLATMVPPEDWTDIKNFCVYIIHTADQLLIKRLYQKSAEEWVMISDNEEAYPQVLLRREDVLQLWMLRRHIRSRAPLPRDVKITA
jgi:phage repressor protein C with HTH and peptisase S24 domain